MQSGDLTYWLAWVLGVLVVGLGVTLTWWGLFGDRARGRRRCPRCWHDLSHTPGMTCSVVTFLRSSETRETLTALGSLSSSKMQTPEEKAFT